MAVTRIKIPQLTDGTAGRLITWDAAGLPTTVATGTSGHVLTSNGVGAAPTFQAVAGGGASSGVAGAVQFSDGAGGFNSDAGSIFFDNSINQLQLGGGTGYNLLISGQNGGIDASAASAVTGAYTAYRSSTDATGTVTFSLTNTNTSSATSNSAINLTTSTGGGDPYIRFITAEVAFVAGVDNSASDIFVLGTGTNPSSMTTQNITIAGATLGIMQTSPTAKLHLGAGTATGNTAPLKFTTGTALTTPEDGAIEYHSSHLYFTIGSTRYQLDQQTATVADGDKGDITVSSSGTVWTIDLAAVTLNKLQVASANSKLLGSGSTGSGASYAEISLGSDLTMTSTMLSVTQATTGLAGKIEIATDGEVTTGTDTTRAVTPRSLSLSVYGTKSCCISVSDPLGAAITTGDGKAYVRIPIDVSGMNLVEVGMSLTTASSSGIPTVQLRRVRAGAPVDMLSTKVTVDVSETDSSTAAASYVINASNDDVLTGDHIFVDIDVAGTGAKGLAVTLTFQTP